MCGQYKKAPVEGKNEVLSGVAQRQRRHSCFSLDTLANVKVDVVVNQKIASSKVLDICLGMHSALRMEKKVSAIALSYGFPRLGIDGVFP